MWLKTAVFHEQVYFFPLKIYFLIGHIKQHRRLTCSTRSYSNHTALLADFFFFSRERSSFIMFPIKGDLINLQFWIFNDVICHPIIFLIVWLKDKQQIIMFTRVLRFLSLGSTQVKLYMDKFKICKLNP